MRTQLEIELHAIQEQVRQLEQDLALERRMFRWWIDHDVYFEDDPEHGVRLTWYNDGRREYEDWDDEKEDHFDIIKRLMEG